MGASASKTTRAAGDAARKFPTRTTGPPASKPSPPTTNAPSTRPSLATPRHPGPTVKPQARASEQRDEAINLDASDPDFARSLRQLGAVQPNPTYSNTSTFPSVSSHPQSQFRSPFPDPRKNPALMVLEARNKIQDAADQEFLEAGRRGFQGRQFLDVGILRQILLMRERGQSGAEIEKALDLKAGVVARLGPEGIVGTTTMPPDDETKRGPVDMV